MTDEEKFTPEEYGRYLWATEVKRSSYKRIESVFQIYAVLGAAMGVLALIYFVFRKLEIELTPSDQKILIVAGTSFAISILSAMLLFVRRQRYQVQLERGRYLNAASEFLMEWAHFESLSKMQLEATGREFNRMSIRAIIQELLATQMVSVEDAIQLEEVLRYRNQLVHGDAPADTDTLSRMTQKLRTVIAKILLGRER